MCICSLFLLTVLLCSLFIQFPGRYYYGVLTGSQQVLWTDGVFINQVRFEATASDQLPDLYQYVCSGYPSLVRRTWQQTFDFQPQGSNILNNVGFSVLDDSPLQVSVQNPGSCSLELWVVRGTEQIHSVLTVGEKLGNIPSGNSGIVQFSDTLYRGDYNYVFVNPYDCTADATTHSVFSLNDWEFDPNCSTPICTTSSQMCTVNVNTGTYFYASGPLPANPDQSQSTIGYTGYFYIDGEECVRFNHLPLFFLYLICFSRWKYWLLYGGLFLGMILSMVITRKMMDMSNPQHSAQNATDDTAPLINPQQQNTTATSYGSSVNAPQVDAPPSYNQL